MKYLLLAMLVFWGLTYWANRVSDNQPNSDAMMVSSIAALVCGAMAAVLTVIYLGLAFWFHQFL